MLNVMKSAFGGKKILFGLAITLFGLFAFAIPAHAAVQDWNLTGNWVINFSLDGINYDPSYYDLSLTQTGGSLIGLGQYPHPGSYSYAWTAVGSITGNTFTLTDTYTLGAVGTTMHMSGTVASDGTISGIWDDDYGGYRSGTWKTISGKAVPVCTQTGFFRDGINMTALLVNPISPVTGTVNATGCNIGVYYGPDVIGTVDNADVYGANYYGIVNQKGSVDISESKIHDIGEVPFNGAQHGVGIYYANVIGLQNGDCDLLDGNTSGTIDNNIVTMYQKGGIVITCGNTSVSVTNNTVTGQGPISYIAQNGIQISTSAVAEALTGNTVTENAYLTGQNMALGNGPWISCGLLFYDSGMSKNKASLMSQNTIRKNRANLCNF